MQTAYKVTPKLFSKKSFFQGFQMVTSRKARELRKLKIKEKTHVFARKEDGLLLRRDCGAAREVQLVDRLSGSKGHNFWSAKKLQSNFYDEYKIFSLITL
jgi:hypothetical protein